MARIFKASLTTGRSHSNTSTGVLMAGVMYLVTRLTPFLSPMMVLFCSVCSQCEVAVAFVRTGLLPRRASFDRISRTVHCVFEAVGS